MPRLTRELIRERCPTWPAPAIDKMIPEEGMDLVDFIDREAPKRRLKTLLWVALQPLALEAVAEFAKNCAHRARTCAEKSGDSRHMTAFADLAEIDAGFASAFCSAELQKEAAFAAFGASEAARLGDLCFGKNGAEATAQIADIRRLAAAAA